MSHTPRPPPPPPLSSLPTLCPPAKAVPAATASLSLSIASRHETKECVLRKRPPLSFLRPLRLFLIRRRCRRSHVILAFAHLYTTLHTTLALACAATLSASPLYSLSSSSSSPPANNLWASFFLSPGLEQELHSWPFLVRSFVGVRRRRRRRPALYVRRSS